MSDPNRPPAPPPDGGITVSNPATRVARGPQADAQRIAFPAPVFREFAADAASPADGAAAGGAPGRRRVAVLVCHGMGQQVPFENIDLIAGALEKADREKREPAPAKDGDERPRVRFARLGKQWLPRAEVALDTGERPTDVHVYEAYWAPLTEGRVSALDVTRFLLSAGFRGLRYALRGRFDRWIFGGPKEFRLPTGSPLALVAAFVVVVSALALYAALGALAVLKLLGLFVAEGVMAGEAKRLSAGLGTELLRSPLVLSLLLAPWMAVSWTGRLIGRAGLGGTPAARESRGIKSVAVSAVVVLCAVMALDALLAKPLLGAALLDTIVPGAARVFGGWAWLALLAVAIGAWLALSAPLASLCRKSSERPWASGMSLSATGLLALWLIVSAGRIVGGLGGWIARTAPADPSIAIGRPLLFLFIASAAYLCWVLRGLYIQYMGDVAVYLSSHTLNEFHELRGRIRQTGTEVGCAVYGARNETDTGWEYEEVLVAGHSLGSVVAYDTLNELLNEERRGGEFPVEARTRALVTFGSPLDKSAFIFRTQKEDARYREALAAAVQPLIEPVTAGGAPASQGRTIPWRNIHSPFDPISGPVNYYDPPDGSPLPEHHEIVDNQPDRRACVFGAAHVSYWENPLLVDWLHAQLTTARKPAPK